MLFMIVLMRFKMEVMERVNNAKKLEMNVKIYLMMMVGIMMVNIIITIITEEENNTHQGIIVKGMVKMEKDN